MRSHDPDQGASVLTPAAYADQVEESEHLVQFYENEGFLLDGTARFIGAGLAVGDTVVCIATEAHGRGIEERLWAAGHDVAAARGEGRYVSWDAAEILARLLVDRWPNEHRFREIVGEVIARTAESSRPRRVRVFGEMVALLCLEGTPEAAIRLEELWNGLADALPFSLLCAYPLRAFPTASHGDSFAGVCNQHTRVRPAESYGSLDSEERLRGIAALQQKASALDVEVGHRDRAAEAHARLAAIVESSDDAIISKTLDGVISSWNSAAERIFGYTAAEMIGQPVSRLAPPDRRDDFTMILDSIRSGVRVDHFETERVRKDGRRIHVSLTVSPIRDANGRIIGASKIARDVTDRKRAEAERDELLRMAEQARAAAEGANRAKDDFLAMLGHELRNPLAAVQSAISAALLDPSRRTQALHIARRQAAQLGHLVDDLLDVARITEGKIVLRKERVRLARVVERAVESTRTHIEERGHTLSVSVPSDPRVDVDAGRMEQVVVNLLTNAAKYTPPGGRIEVIGETAGQDILLRVRDTGIGISAEMLPRVFDPFSQADLSLDRAQGGLGLGLALVRQLVELHGGRVKARSDGCGQGAEFAVYLPAARDSELGLAPGASEASGLRRRGAGARVLLVEDNVDTAEALGLLLESLGHAVEVVHDGLAALDAMPRVRPDVMLVDIGLPGIDGFEVARRLQMLPGRRNALLVALTGYGREEDKQQTRAAGFDDHLTKPVDIEALETLIERHAAGRGLDVPLVFHRGAGEPLGDFRKV